MHVVDTFELLRQVGELEIMGGEQGKRLYLRKVGEEKETERLYSLRRRMSPPAADPENDPRFLVFFELERVRPLVGDAEDA